MTTLGTKLTHEWYEPAGCSSARGWLRTTEGTVGYYLDYEPGHYRSPHKYCRAGQCDCADSQPGNVLAVRFSTQYYSESHWFETTESAKA